MKAYLTVKEVAVRYGVSTTTVWLWVRKGILPSPVKLGERAVRWSLEELLSYEAARKQKPDALKGSGVSNPQQQQMYNNLNMCDAKIQ